MTVGNLKRLFILLLALGCTFPIWAFTGTLTIKGTQSSEGDICADYWMLVISKGGGLYGLRTIVPIIDGHYVAPDSQFVTDWDIEYNLSPDITRIFADRYGNNCIYLVYGDTANPIVHFGDTTELIVRQTGAFVNEMILDGMITTDAFPCFSYPDSVLPYLDASPNVESTHPAIVAFAEANFAPGCDYNYQVVSRVFKWVMQNVTWERDLPRYYDALEIFSDTIETDPDKRYRTQCIGFAHLPLAFLRALHIPARYVTGTSLGSVYDVPTGAGYTYFGECKYFCVSGHDVYWS